MRASLLKKDTAVLWTASSADAFFGVYTRSFKRASEIFESMADKVPPGWQLGRLNAQEVNAIVYAEPPEPVEANQINTLGRAG